MNAIRNVIRSLKAAGDPVVAVHDGEYDVIVSGERDAMRIVGSVEVSTLYTRSGVFVTVLPFEDEDDQIANYSASAMHIIDPELHAMLRD